MRRIICYKKVTMSRLLSTIFFNRFWLCRGAKTVSPDPSEQVDRDVCLRGRLRFGSIATLRWLVAPWGVVIHQKPVCSPSEKRGLTSSPDVYIVIT